MPTSHDGELGDFSDLGDLGRSRPGPTSPSSGWNGTPALPPPPPRGAWGQTSPGGFPPPPGQSSPPAVPAGYDAYDPGQRTGPRTDPSSMLWWAILSTLCCCTPAGIVAIVFAAQARSHATSGRAEQARSADDTARMWVLISVALGALGMVGAFIDGLASV